MAVPSNYSAKTKVTFLFACLFLFLFVCCKNSNHGLV